MGAKSWRIRPLQKINHEEKAVTQALLDPRRVVVRGRGYTHFLPGEVPEWPNGAPC